MKSILSIAILALVLLSFNSNGQTPIRKGEAAPDLEYMNPDGKLMSLCSLKGKIVLIDFWASWCGPCRRANPHLVSLNDKFSSKKFESAKGFEIFSVSLDKNKQAWVNAIEKDKLNWSYHISDLKGWQSAAARTYGVNSIPASILVDENGVIIGKNLRPNDLDYELSKRLKR